MYWLHNSLLLKVEYWDTIVLFFLFEKHVLVICLLYLREYNLHCVLLSSLYVCRREQSYIFITNNLSVVLLVCLFVYLHRSLLFFFWMREYVYNRSFPSYTKILPKYVRHVTPTYNIASYRHVFLSCFHRANKRANNTVGLLLSF